MNDAAEFETSLTGALDFFQNLRRKLGTLDTETGVQRDQLQDIAATVVALQQDQQQAGQTLSALADRLQAQGDALRQELQAAAEQQAPTEQIATLETQVASHADALRSLLKALQTLGQDAQTLREQVQTLGADLEPLEPAIRAGEEQWRQLQQEVAGVKDELATQRQVLADADLLQQNLQRQQDRLKHVETFMGKVAADTNSTRQILNVLQTDLTTQSDTLQEFDQFWRDGFATAQDRPLVLEKPAVATGVDDLAVDLSTLRQTLMPRIEMLDELQQSAQRQTQSQWEQISQLEAALNELRQLPVSATTRHNSESTDLTARHETLTVQIEALDEAQHAVRQQLQTQRERLGAIETALDDLQQVPAPETKPELLDAELATLHHALAAQDTALNALRQTTQQQLAELAAALENQRSVKLQQEAFASPVADPSSPAAELRQGLEDLEQTVTVLETRLVSQAQAFSGNFEQFRGLQADIQDVQDHLNQLESSPQHWTALERELAEQVQDVAQLKAALQQVQADSQQLLEATRQGSGGAAQLIELEAHLFQQAEQLNQFSATLETMRTEAKATQDKVVTMATNVAKRMHEFQNQMTAVETTQGERLQELEQKIIWLQAALETQENQPKPRRWFSIPASLTSVALMAGAALLMMVTQVT